MTEAESEVELGAAEEESTTEAAPQRPGILTKSTSTPGAALTAPAVLLEVHLDFHLSTRQQLHFLRTPECLEDLPLQQLPYRHVSCPNRSTVPATSKITSNNSIQQPCWLSPRHDHRPQYFALRLRDNALLFYTTFCKKTTMTYSWTHFDRITQQMSVF